MPPEYGDAVDVIGAQLPADCAAGGDADDLRALAGRACGVLALPPLPSELALAALARRVDALESRLRDIEGRHPQHRPPPALRR